MELVNQQIKTIQDQVANEGKEKDIVINTLLEQLKAQQSQIQQWVTLLSANNSTPEAAVSSVPVDLSASSNNGTKLEEEKQAKMFFHIESQQVEPKKFFQVEPECEKTTKTVPHKFSSVNF